MALESPRPEVGPLQVETLLIVPPSSGRCRSVTRMPRVLGAIKVLPTHPFDLGSIPGPPRVK